LWGGTAEKHKMANITNMVASFVILAVLATLCVTIYEGVESSYNVTRGDVLTVNETTGNIADQFKALYLIEAVAETQTGINKLKAPSGVIDILGALATAGIGALKTVGGVIVIPYQITNIVFSFYAGEIPGIVAGLVMMVVVYVGMIVLAVFLRRDRI